MEGQHVKFTKFEIHKVLHCKKGNITFSKTNSSENWIMLSVNSINCSKFANVKERRDTTFVSIDISKQDKSIRQWVFRKKEACTDCNSFKVVSQNAFSCGCNSSQLTYIWSDDFTKEYCNKRDFPVNEIQGWTLRLYGLKTNSLKQFWSITNIKIGFSFKSFLQT